MSSFRISVPQEWVRIGSCWWLYQPSVWHYRLTASSLLGNCPWLMGLPIIHPHPLHQQPAADYPGMQSHFCRRLELQPSPWQMLGQQGCIIAHLILLPPQPSRLFPFSFSWAHTLHKSQAPKGLSGTASRGPNLRLTTRIRLAAIHSAESEGLSEIRKWKGKGSHVWLFATPWTIAYQATLSMGFSRQEYWSGLPFPSPGYLPDPGIEPGSPTS